MVKVKLHIELMVSYVQLSSTAVHINSNICTAHAKLDTQENIAA
jgi:hypothetical protein